MSLGTAVFADFDCEVVGAFGLGLAFLLAGGGSCSRNVNYEIASAKESFIKLRLDVPLPCADFEPFSFALLSKESAAFSRDRRLPKNLKGSVNVWNNNIRTRDLGYLPLSAPLVERVRFRFFTGLSSGNMASNKVLGFF